MEKLHTDIRDKGLKENSAAPYALKIFYLHHQNAEKFLIDSLGLKLQNT